MHLRENTPDSPLLCHTAMAMQACTIGVIAVISLRSDYVKLTNKNWLPLKPEKIDLRTVRTPVKCDLTIFVTAILKV
jgi:hypothetical protein